MSLQRVKQVVDEKDVRFFLCSFVEMSGAPKAKLVPATQLEDMAEEGAGFAGFAFSRDCAPDDTGSTSRSALCRP